MHYNDAFIIFMIGPSKIAKNQQNECFSQFLSIFDGPIKKYYRSKVVVHKNRH